MKIPIEVHELKDILYYDGRGLLLTDFRDKIFEARPRCVHQYVIEYSVKKREIVSISECVYYHQELNRIERDCAFFRIDNRNGTDTDFNRFSRFDDL